MDKKFAEMTGPELVHEHNALVARALTKGLAARTVARFVDLKTGVKRCEALASSLRAAAEAERAHVERGAERASQEGRSREDQPAATPRPATQESETVAKKSTKKNGAAKAPRKAAPKKEKGVAEGISGEFGCRPGTNKEKLLLAMPVGEQVKLDKLIKSVYGREATPETHRTALVGGVLLGLKVAIEEGKLPYEIRHERGEDKVTTYGLHRA